MSGFRRLDAIGRTLRKMYGDVVTEGDTPDEFLDISRSSGGRCFS